MVNLHFARAMRCAALAHLSQAACRPFCGVESGAAHEARSEAPKAGGWRILRVARCLADEGIGNRSKFKGRKYRFALIPLGHRAMVKGAKYCLFPPLTPCSFRLLMRSPLARQPCVGRFASHTPPRLVFRVKRASGRLALLLAENGLNGHVQ